jgi:hypothetical protein
MRDGARRGTEEGPHGFHGDPTPGGAQGGRPDEKSIGNTSPLRRRSLRGAPPAP